MSDQKDRKQDETKGSKPRHVSNEIVDRSKSSSGNEYRNDPTKRPVDKGGDSKRASDKPRLDAGKNPQPKKQEEPRR
jgi:hypothetical protein